MPRAVPLVFVPLACLVLAGCPAAKPWQGVEAREFATLNQHRLVGIAHMEDKQEASALPEFQAIRKAQPGLAFGWVNEAFALLATTAPREVADP